MKRVVLPLLAIGFFLSPLMAADDLKPNIKTEIVSEVRQAAPGGTILIGVRFKIQKEWHIYWKIPGDAGFATTVAWTTPHGVSVSELQWPAPEIFRQDGDIRTIGYKGETILLASVKIPSDWPANKPIDLSAKVKWLACKVACVPGGSQISKRLLVGPQQITDKDGAALLSSYLKMVPTTDGENKILAMLKSPTASSAMGFITALLFAFVGGLLLNIMPCVLPVLSIKVFRLVKHGEADQPVVIKESLAYLVGVLLSFSILAGVVIGLKSIGQQIGWGFQFQEPRFVIALIAILFISGLSFLGFFEFSVLVPSALTNKLQQSGIAGALWDGFLATLLATPCTAPFLGAALGFSFSQPSAIIFLFFLVIGMGLALPYVLFAIIPKTRALLPKPGMWMQVFKEGMGFPLFATVVWLLWILGQQRGGGTIVAVLILLLALMFALWGTKHWKGTWSRPLLLIFVIAIYAKIVEPSLRSAPEMIKALAEENSGIIWQPFSPSALNDLLAQKKTVFVDFTAKWCLTCQLNKRVVHSAKVARAFKEAGVVTMEGDWTNRSEEITQTLQKWGRSGVPVYALFKNGDPTPVLLPELLTEKAVLDALQQTN